MHMSAALPAVACLIKYPDHNTQLPAASVERLILCVAPEQGVVGRDESPQLGMLSVVQRVLEEVHAETLRRFDAAGAGKSTDSEQAAWDARTVLKDLRAKVNCLQASVSCGLLHMSL